MSGVNETPRSFATGVALLVLGLGSFGPAVSADVTSTATTIVSSPNPAAVRSPITLTAVVSPAPTGGTVSFTDNVVPIAACDSLPLIGAFASCAVSYASVGSHTFVASYSGTTGFAASMSPAVSEVVTAIHCLALAGCNLSDTDAAGADLPGANLSGANLHRAYLTRVNLMGANLTRANLSGANLDGANLTGATLVGAITSAASFKGAVWSRTMCPDGTPSDAHDDGCSRHLKSLGHTAAASQVLESRRGL